MPPHNHSSPQPGGKTARLPGEARGVLLGSSGSKRRRGLTEGSLSLCQQHQETLWASNRAGLCTRSGICERELSSPGSVTTPGIQQVKARVHS